MNNTEGSCFCGEIRIELAGDALDMGYCHCASCREWSGDPIHAWTIWREDQVKLIDEAGQLNSFQKTPDSLSHRKFCTKCGGHMMIHHPELGVYDVFPGILKAFEFNPVMHINCAERAMSYSDNLPKYKDFPAEYEAFGGTGELLPD